MFISGSRVWQLRQFLGGLQSNALNAHLASAVSASRCVLSIPSPAGVNHLNATHSKSRPRYLSADLINMVDPTPHPHYSEDATHSMHRPTYLSIDPVNVLGHVDKAFSPLSPCSPKRSRRPRRHSIARRLENAMASPSPTVLATFDIAYAGFSVFQEELSSFESRSESVMSILNELSKIHPFISVAVVALKTAIRFGVACKRNDKRITGINVRMLDAIDALSLLKDFTQEQAEQEMNGAQSLRLRLRPKVNELAEIIKRYSAICDTYHKQPIYIQLFKSLELEDRLKHFAVFFDQCKQDIQSSIYMNASLMLKQVSQGVVRISRDLRSVNSTTSMALLLDQLRSPEERELRRFIDSKGGPAQFLSDDNLMQTLIQRSRGKDLDGKTQSLSPGTQTELSKTVKRQISRAFMDMVKENEEIFSLKFDAQEKILRGVSAAAKREDDRVIEAITSGPHERILDPHLYAVWKEMGWKGSAKARHLVMALREYFAERRRLTGSTEKTRQTESQDIKPPHSQIDSTKAHQIARGTSGDAKIEDEWALQYISILRIQPLLEAFDDDASKFVSVAEVNAFTTARPQGWSLPHWIAYWTAGYPLALRRYYIGIQIILARISVVSRKVLPTNRVFVDQLNWHSSATLELDQLLAGVHSAVEDLGGDEELFHRFKGFVDDEELRMQTTLESIKYNIDAPNTLRLVIGPGRLEKHLVPVIFLLLKQSLQVMYKACKVPLHYKELSSIIGSLRTIWVSLRQRIDTIKALCRLQSLNIRDEIRKFSYGMYFYFVYTSEFEQTTYFSSIYLQDQIAVHRINDEDYLASHIDMCDTLYGLMSDALEDPTQKLSYAEHEDKIDLGGYSEPLEKSLLFHDDTDSELGSCSHPWRGSYSYKGFEAKYSAGTIHLSIPPIGVDTGTVSGTGMDTIGDFTVEGVLLQRVFISFNKQYLSHDKTAWRFQGSIDGTRQEISGVWGYMDSGNDNFNVRLDDDHIAGSFEYYNSPVRSRLFRPTPEELTSNKPQALWRFAIKMIRHKINIRAGRFSWGYLQERRGIRKRLVELFAKRNHLLNSGLASNVPLTTEEADELSELVSMCSEADLRCYRSLAVRLQRRSTIFFGTSCHSPGCMRTDLKGTCVICLDCVVFDPETDKESDRIDFCGECAEVTITHLKESLHHTQNHSVLQMRKNLPRREFHALIKEGWEMSNEMRQLQQDTDISSMARKTCYRCKKDAMSPFWSCLDCDDIYICVECNRTDDKYHSVLFDDIYVNRKSCSEYTGKGGKKGAGLDGKNENAAREGDMSSLGPIMEAPIPTVHETTRVDYGEYSVAITGDYLQSGLRCNTTGLTLEDTPQHLWTHPLVLCQSLEPVPAPDGFSAEERLASLQDQFSGLVDQFNRREDRSSDRFSELDGRFANFESRMDCIESLLITVANEIGRIVGPSKGQY